MNQAGFENLCQDGGTLITSSELNPYHFMNSQSRIKDLIIRIITITLTVTMTTSTSATPTSPFTAGDMRKSGTVHFEISCAPEVAEDFETAVALLHSFFYDEARLRFEDIAQRDPDCAMAWWGVAMTWYHPLWAPPTDDENEKGLKAAQKAKAIGGKTELEKSLIDAIGGYFGDIAAKKTVCLCPPTVDFSCHGPRTHTARAQAYHEAMKRLHEQYPNNAEITIFYTLSLLGTASPKDKGYSRQKEAGAILESLFKTNPDHPGIAHYIIHAYDYPELAPRALDASRRYDDIAPWVPHALHMPSHIYTRLGMWEDSIASNVASSQAAREYAARRHQGASMMDDLHAMDYLMFAYLQTGRDDQAEALLDHMGKIESILPQNGFASAYAVCAMPARYTLERGDWATASLLAMPFPEFTQSFPFAQAHIEFARAIGAARNGNLELAQKAAKQLLSLREALSNPKFQWWTQQIEIQRLSAEAWIAFAQGDASQALQLLQAAVAIEESIGTHPVTPGQILPTREQLGEMYLELAKPEEAMAEFRRSLEAFPHRFRSHLGAARCARFLGHFQTATKHHAALQAMTNHNEYERVDLEQLVSTKSLSLSMR